MLISLRRNIKAEKFWEPEVSILTAALFEAIAGGGRWLLPFVLRVLIEEFTEAEG